MKVLLDLNNLGRGFSAEATRTGIFRATEGLVHALLGHPGVAVAVTAADSWVSELQLLLYCRQRARELESRVVRAWEQPHGRDEEGTELITRILAAEAEGRDARRDRATLMLLNATARRRALPDEFAIYHSLRAPLPDPRQVTAQARAVTVHDLVPLYHPEWSYEGAEDQCRAIVGSIVRGHDFVVANSEATAQEVRAHLGLSAERIFVTPLAAAAEFFYPEQDPERLARVRARYGIPAGRYLLSLCTLEPRKNLPHLVRCFVRHAEQAGPELYLVLAGPAGWKTDALLDSLAERPELRSRIVVTGFVDDGDLAALYSGAAVFVYPSPYEGFGLPVLESLQCGTPVITSTAGALPEVTGAAAICVPPTDADALTHALRMVLADPGRSEELRRRGIERAGSFSWAKTADRTVEAYRRMLELSLQAP